MSATSPDIQASSSSDPFQLDRLAEELVSKELSEPKVNDSGAHDLPIYVPLSHDNTYLSAANFDVEEFLLSRSHTSLHDLRIELRDYQSALKEELVKLINDDYEAFISLSTDLKGEGARLNRLKTPLSGLKSQILVSKAELCTVQADIEDKLEKRAVLREEKALLHLLLRISESVERLESLLLIASPSQDTTDTEDFDRFRISSNMNANTNDNVHDERSRTNRAKHLSRVAAEYTQLLYHASKARGEKCAFVNEIQWRIDRIQSTLSSDLDLLFASTLNSLTGSGGSELEKSKLIADLTECLRTYDVLGLWRDAEDILRKEVVRIFIKKTVFPGALSAPHSPLLPHTPFRSSTTTSFTSSSSVPPKTPFTPYTAFSTQQSAFRTSVTTDLSSPYARILDDSEEPLAKLYTQILRFVERDLSRIMDIADKVSIKSHASSTSLPATGIAEVSDNTDGQGFQIMANVIWEEFGRAIMDDLGTVVFAAGRPNEFRKSYEITQAFIRSLEFLAPSVHSVECMRSHPVYATFEKRWQLPVYFQMRWKEIVSKVEGALAVSQLDVVSKSGSNSFVTPQANAIWIGLTACWSAEVYIPELSYRFLRLTLQLLSRYRSWVDQTVLDNTSTQSTTASGNDKASGSNSRSSTPVPSENSSAEAFAMDEALLRKYVAVAADIKTLQSSVMTLWTEEISIMLPDTQESDIEDPNTEDVLQNTLLALSSLISPMTRTISSILTKRCNDALLPVRSIPSQFRAMSNKRPPTEPSPFVSSILRPVKSFFGIGTGDGVGTLLKEDYLQSISSEVFENVCQRYVYYIAAMKKTEESLRRLKKGKKNTFSLFGSAAKEDEGRDEERIRTQLILDVEAFGRDVKLLGVQLEKSEPFQSLDNLVRAVDPPETS